MKARHFGGQWAASSGPSVLRQTRTGGPPASRPRSRRREDAPAPVSAARSPANPAAPDGPAVTPADESAATAARASASVTAIAASSPSRRYGHALEDGVPQLSPFITVAAVGTEASAPSARLRS